MTINRNTLNSIFSIIILLSFLFLLGAECPKTDDDDDQEDTTPPIISGLDVIDITDSQATIIWETDDAAISKIEYGLTVDYTESVENTSETTSHSVGLTGLSTSKEYHYKVTCTNHQSLFTSTLDNTFTTTDGSVMSITAPSEGTLEFNQADSISCEATISGPSAGETSNIVWLITKQEELDTVEPFPNTGTGKTFSFYTQRRNRGTVGGYMMIPSLSYKIKASLEGSCMNSITIVQEVKHTIIDEYLYFGVTEPSPSDFVTGITSTYFEFRELNTGNYSSYAILPSQLITRLTQMRSEYGSLIIGPPYGNHSCYRNPERNAIVGGVLNSYHQYGRAVDLHRQDNLPDKTFDETLEDMEAWVEEKWPGVAVGIVYPGTHLHVHWLSW